MRNMDTRTWNRWVGWAMLTVSMLSVGLSLYLGGAPTWTYPIPVIVVTAGAAIAYLMDP